MAFTESQIVRKLRKHIDDRSSQSSTTIAQEIFFLFELLNLLNRDVIEPDPPDRWDKQVKRVAKPIPRKTKAYEVTMSERAG